MPEPMFFQVPETAAGQRLDKWLVSQDTLELTRSALQTRMEQGDVLVNAKPVAKNYRLRGGETVELILPDPEPLELVPENIPLSMRMKTCLW